MDNSISAEFFYTPNVFDLNNNSGQIRNSNGSNGKKCYANEEDFHVTLAVKHVKNVLLKHSEFKERHKQYKQKIIELEATQAALAKEIQSESQLLTELRSSITRLSATCNVVAAANNATRATGDENADVISPSAALEQLRSLNEQVKEKARMLEEVRLWLPQKNAWILSAHLGSIKASFLKKEEKLAYKEEYERFKFIFTIISFCFVIMNLFLINTRVTDALYHFLLVWYYCTITLREHVLRTNGSRILPWWLLHHYLTIVVSGVLLTWPESWSYSQYRNSFLHFSLCLTFVQLLQYYYQRGHLYRLRALGGTGTSKLGGQMTLTVEGFQGWMWRGLSFIIPFLLVVYALELYNAYILYHLSYHPMSYEWQIPVVGILFLCLGTGNILALLSVIWRKLHTRKDFGLNAKYKAF